MEFERSENGFFEKAREIAIALQEFKQPLIVHHHDADGVCSAAIISTALERQGSKTSFQSVKQLYKADIEEIKEKAREFVFVDFGSNKLEELKEGLKARKFAVLDHHQIHSEKRINCKLHLNPWLFGINGLRELSGSGVCYFVAEALNEKNKDLSVLAVVGAVGDMQDSSGKLEGLNKKIAKIAEKQGLLEVKQDLRLFGRVSRPLTQFLEFSNNPILPGLTANKENCIRFLQELGIELKQGEKWRAFNDLSEEEKKKLTTALILHLKQCNEPEWKIQSLIGEVFELVKEIGESPLREAKEFATVLNACARHEMSETAIAICKGKRNNEDYAKALSLLAEHRRQLAEAIQFVTEEKGLKENPSFYYFEAGERVKESIVGIVAGMLYGSGIIEQNKPIIGIAELDEKNFKASARANAELVRKGVNLGKVLKEISGEIDSSEGGGHSVAAGIKFPKEKKQEFLKLLEEKLSKTI